MHGYQEFRTIPNLASFPVHCVGPAWQVVSLLELVQVLESGQNNLLAGLLNFTSKKDLVENGIDLARNPVSHSILLSFLPENGEQGEGEPGTHLVEVENQI